MRVIAQFVRLRNAVLFLVFCSIRVFAQQDAVETANIILSSNDADSTKVTLLFELGRDNWFSRNFAVAAHLLNKATELGALSGIHTHQADAFNILANVHMNQGLFDQAFDYLQKALDEQHEKFLPLIHETYSRLYYQLGDYPSSLHYALQAAEGFEKNSDPAFNMQAVFAYVIAGDVLNRQNLNEKAFEYYQKAYKKGRTSPENWYIKTPLQKIAQYYLSVNELDKAQHLYDSIILIDAGSWSQEPTMFSYEGLGIIAMKQKKFKNAIQFYRQALLYARQKNLSINIETFHTRLGSAFLADNQIDSARHYLELAIQQSRASKGYENLSAAYLQLSSLHQQQSHYQQAFSAFQLHKAYQDSILNVQKMRTVNNLEVLYQTRQKENEILALQKTDQEKDFAIKKRNLYISITVGLLTTSGVILLLILHNHRNKQYLNDERVKQMEQQQQVIALHAMINGQEAERMRVARDLHDGLGSLFSTVKMHFSALQHEMPVLKHHELFQKCYGLADRASVDVRNIAHNMMPEVLMKLGLINATKDLCNNISSGKPLSVSVEAYGMGKRLNPSTEILLYRIIQELLNNIIKHAHATEAIVQFTKDHNRLSVVVEDNGQGFNTLETDEEKHSGILGIKSRVDYLNGKLTIDSQTNVCTTIMMDFLVEDEPHSNNNGVLLQ